MNTTETKKQLALLSLFQTVAQKEIEELEFSPYIDPHDPDFKGIQNLGIVRFKDGTRSIYNILFTDKDVKIKDLEESNDHMARLICNLKGGDETFVFPAYNICVSTKTVENIKENDVKGFLHFGLASNDNRMITDAYLIELNTVAMNSDLYGLSSWCKENQGLFKEYMTSTLKKSQVISLKPNTTKEELAKAKEKKSKNMIHVSLNLTDEHFIAIVDNAELLENGA